MGPLVVVEMVTLSECLVAHVASIRLFTRVHTFMHLQVDFLAERLRTQLTLKRLFTGMDPFVAFQVGPLAKRLATIRAAEVLAPSKGQLMVVQICAP